MGFACSVLSLELLEPSLSSGLTGELTPMCAGKIQLRQSIFAILSREGWFCKHESTLQGALNWLGVSDNYRAVCFHQCPPCSAPGLHLRDSLGTGALKVKWSCCSSCHLCCSLSQGLEPRIWQGAVSEGSLLLGQWGGGS